jgi:AraC family transcriptional regulator
MFDAIAISDAWSPLASIDTAVPSRSRVSVRDAARNGRESLPIAAGHATTDPHECAVGIFSGGRRLLARWSATKPSTLSIDRRGPSRAASDSDPIRVSLHGTLAATGTKTGAVHFGHHATARIDAGDAFARECVARLFDPAWQGRDAATPFADALLRALALHVHARYAAHAAATERRDRLAAALAQHLASFIDAGLDRRLSRAELARAAGYDAREFSIAFRNTFGMTPMQYVIERRLDRACLLIASTAHDLADIAIGAGFSSQSHLTSTLKKRRGITPLKLRREAFRAIAPAHG